MKNPPPIQRSLDPHPSHGQHLSEVGVSRRRFLANSAGLAAVVSLPVTAVAAETPAAGPPPRQSPSAKDLRGPSPLLTIDNEPPARLIVDPPLPAPLALGRVFIQYRTENLRVVPVFGKAALEVSPRLGHVHITVDDAKWHFVDASGETLILVGLEPGPHQVVIELANAAHQVLTSETVKFTVPASTTSKPHGH